MLNLQKIKFFFRQSVAYQLIWMDSTNQDKFNQSRWIWLIWMASINQNRFDNSGWILLIGADLIIWDGFN